MGLDKVRFGLVGCGRVAPRHVQSLQEIEGAELVAVTDVVSARAERIAKEFGYTLESDFAGLLDRTDIDVIIICTPSGLHAQMGIQAAHAGKHVLVEKPIALTLDDADALIEACTTEGVELSVVLQNRYNPRMLDLRCAVDEGRLGKLRLGAATVRWYRPQEYYDDGWHGTYAMDGGVLLNQAIHHIDALQWFFGEVESVFAYTATLAHQIETDDVGIGVVRFKNGALATIEGSTITYPQNLEGSLTIFGEKGSVKVGGPALNRIAFWKVAGELEHEREMLTRQEVDPPTVYGYSHKQVIAEMAAAVRAGRVPDVTGKTARASLALVLALYDSALSGTAIQL